MIMSVTVPIPEKFYALYLITAKFLIDNIIAIKYK